MVADGKNITLTFWCTGQLSINNATWGISHLMVVPIPQIGYYITNILIVRSTDMVVIYQFQHIKDWFLIANVRNLSQTSFAAATPVIPILLCLSFDHLTNYKGNFCSIDICRRHQSCICFRVYTGRRL